MAQRSKAALVVLIIGLIILILAPIWKWGIGPSLVKVPDTIDTKSVYEGQLTLFVDPTTLSALPPELAVKIPLTITRHDVSQPAKSSSSVALVKETINAIGPAGKSFISQTKYFALDRKTSQNVSDHGSDKNRTGYFVLLPIGVQKQTYNLWDDDIMKAGPATFVKVTKVNGIKTKNATAYVFHASGSDPMVNPPLGLPKSVSGAEIKSILGNPNFAVNDTQQYPINYIKKTDATIVVDQKTGAPINLPAYTETYYVDASGLGQANIKLGTLSYKQTPENVAAVLDDAAESYGLLSMVGLWIPLVLLILGVIITVIGAIWLSRKKEPKAPAAA